MYIIREEIERTKRVTKSEVRIKAILVERIKIKKQLVKLGFKLNTTPDNSVENESE